MPGTDTTAFGALAASRTGPVGRARAASNRDSQAVEAPAPPQPDPALKRLDRLVGRWRMEGNLVGSDEKTIRGETSFRWLPGGFFLEQRAHIDFGELPIDAWS